MLFLSLIVNFLLFYFQELTFQKNKMVGGKLQAFLLLILISHYKGTVYSIVIIIETQLKLYFSAFGQSDTAGPVFIQEPPNYVDFSNTTGTKIICQARGVPLPNITWTKSNGEPIGTVPGLRQVSFDPISYLIGNLSMCIFLV